MASQSRVSRYTQIGGIRPQTTTERCETSRDANDLLARQGHLWRGPFSDGYLIEVDDSIGNFSMILPQRVAPDLAPFQCSV
jgi:hypothetical protein